MEDLHIEPESLFVKLFRYNSPFDLLDDPISPYFVLKAGYEEDNAHVSALAPSFSTSAAEVYELPCEAWARRISGVFGNALANQSPDKAHAVITLNGNQSDYTVSVRAPLSNRTGADEVCTQFATGGAAKRRQGLTNYQSTRNNAFSRLLIIFTTNFLA